MRTLSPTMNGFSTLDDDVLDGVVLWCVVSVATVFRSWWSCVMLCSAWSIMFTICCCWLTVSLLIRSMSSSISLLSMWTIDSRCGNIYFCVGNIDDLVATIWEMISIYSCCHSTTSILGLKDVSIVYSLIWTKINIMSHVWLCLLWDSHWQLRLPMRWTSYYLLAKGYVSSPTDYWLRLDCHVLLHVKTSLNLSSFFHSVFQQWVYGKAKNWNEGCLDGQKVWFKSPNIQKPK